MAQMLEGSHLAKTLHGIGLLSICHSEKPVVMVHGTKQLRKLRGKVIDAPQLFHFITTLCVGTDRMTNICIVVTEANKPNS